MDKPVSNVSNDNMPQANYFAVIDIGSNTVRLVIFSDVVRVPEIIFNEKAFCGLGGEVGSTGLMAESAMEKALDSLTRFKALCRQMNVSRIHAFATAAVRDAKNGADFIAAIEDTTEITVKVIEGVEEARLAALGVVSMSPGITGIVGDLGGGSLELANVVAGEVKDCVSLPIGPLRLKNEVKGGYKATKSFVKEALAGVSWLKDIQGADLYIVGGGWRNIAKLLMNERKDPVQILHGYQVSCKDMCNYSKKLAHMDPEGILAKEKLSPKRREIIPTAALILRVLLKKMDAGHVIASSGGVREGIIFDMLSAEEKAVDPFILLARSLANERCRFPEHGELLYNWTRSLYTNLMDENPIKDRLHHAVCMLSDIAWRGHPDYRAERAVEIALHGRWTGVSHVERAYLGVALNAVYGERADAKPIRNARTTLDDATHDEAHSLGAAIRLAQRLSGGAVAALDVSRLEKDGNTITLWINKEFHDLNGAIVERRLTILGSYFNCDTAVKLEA